LTATVALVLPNLWARPLASQRVLSRGKAHLRFALFSSVQ
jgi:hypothetical protein